MIIGLEKWIESQNFSIEAYSCFRESFICYRAGANKAALLFAYVGLMNVIRDRILTSPCPSGIDPRHWITIQTSMRGAGTWDSEAFDTTQRQKPAPVFIKPDDLRHQVAYWKNRRNDCAHSKDNKITPAYVEALYAFIESNMNKFAVNGSNTEMTRRILEHYDPSITPPGATIEPLIRDIPHAVLHDDLPLFFSNLSQRFDATRNAIDVMIGAVSTSKIDFLNAVLQHGTIELTAACTCFILLDDNLLLALLRSHPDKINILNGQPETTRKLWHDYLFTMSKNDFPILASMIRNRLIPPAQTEECIRHLITKGTAAIPNDIDNRALEENGFYRTLDNILTTTDKLSTFEWANKCKSLIVKLITDHPLSVELAKAIFHNFNSEHVPWHLRSDLNDLFRTNTAKRNEYLAISSANPDIGSPRHIPSITAT